MKIPGYTLHGDYYLADEVIPNKTWKEACKMKEVITLPNDKMVIAHTLSKEELKTIPQEERGIHSFWYYWYWTTTLCCDCYGSNAWYVNSIGDFYYSYIRYCGGCARLGFHKKEIKQFLDIE